MNADKNKAKEMAARLKAEKDERNYGRCPICSLLIRTAPHKPFGVTDNAMLSHIRRHSG